MGDLAKDGRPSALWVTVPVAEEQLLAHGVPTGLGRLKDQAFVEELLQEVLHHHFVAGLGGPDVVVVGDVQQSEHLLKNSRDFID